jgi:hypothetical protein
LLLSFFLSLEEDKAKKLCVKHFFKLFVEFASFPTKKMCGDAIKSLTITLVRIYLLGGKNY